jgi:hypothetical protein
LRYDGVVKVWYGVGAMAVIALLPVLQKAAPDWVDPDTGHRAVRLSDGAGGSTPCFHDNAFSPEGDKLMFNTPNDIAVVDVAKIGRSDSPDNSRLETGMCMP